MESGFILPRRETFSGGGTEELNWFDFSTGFGADPADVSYLRVFELAITDDGMVYAEVQYSALVKVDQSGRPYPVERFPPRMREMKVGPDNLVYMSTLYNGRIFRLEADGIITPIAGNDDPIPADVDNRGVDAMLAKWDFIIDFDFTSDESLVLATAGAGQNAQIWTVDPSTNYVWLTAGALPGAPFATSFDVRSVKDGDFAVGSPIGVESLAAGPDGQPYWTQGNVPAPSGFTSGPALRTVSRKFRSVGLAGREIPSEDGSQVMVFDDRGRHVTTRDSVTGVTLLEFGYNGDGYVDSITDRDGDVTTIVRSPGLIEVTAPDGQMTRIELDSDGYATAVENANTERYMLSYDDGPGLLTAMTTPRGYTHEFEYDNFGRLIRDANPAGGEKTLSSVTTSNTSRRVTLETKLGRTRVYELNRDPEGKETRRHQSSDGTETILSRAADGSTVIEDPTGAKYTTAIVGDPRFGALSSYPAEMMMELPSGVNYSVSLSKTAQLSDPSDPMSLQSLDAVTVFNGRTTSSSWSSSSNTLSTISPEGRISKRVLNTVGRTRSLERGNLAAVNFTYDSHGRPVQVELGEAGDARVTTYEYDAVTGFMSALVDATGRRFEFEADAVGRVTRTIYPDGEAVTVSYDENGGLTSVTPPGRPAHIFTRDEVGNELVYAPPSLVTVSVGETENTYDLDQSVDLVERPDGDFVDPTYRPDGKLTSFATPRGLWSFDYESTTGQLSSIEDPDGGVLSFGYDGPLMTEENYSGSVAWSVVHAPDNDLRLASESVNGEAPILFGYDDDSLLTSAGQTTLGYDPVNGLLESVDVGGVIQDLDYNTFGEPSAITYTSPSGTPYAATYVRDKLGRIVEKTETTGAGTVVHTYGYDLRGRLNSEAHDGVLVHSWSYDANGNREETAPGSAVQPVYDDQDRLLEYGPTTYTWDEDGDLLSKIDAGLGETTTYDYDALGNLLRVDLPSGDVLEYVVDARGRRVAEKRNGTVERAFAYGDQLNPVAELDAAGNVVSRFVYGSRGHVPDYMVTGGVTYRLVTDHLGSVRAVVDVQTGVVVQEMDYSAWGEVLYDSNPGFQPFGYAGGLWTAETGLVRFGARDYEPGVGRWTAKDSMRFKGGHNLYAYADNSPTNLVDPAGLDPEDPPLTPDIDDLVDWFERNYNCDGCPSKTNNTEYCVWFYKAFTISIPYLGVDLDLFTAAPPAGGQSPNQCFPWPGYPGDVPPGYAGDCHSHGSDECAPGDGPPGATCDYEYPSDRDIQTCQSTGGPCYVVTPERECWVTEAPDFIPGQSHLMRAPQS